MEVNNLFNDRYFLERLLGRGNFSEVWLAKDTKTDIKVALKIYAPATGLDDAGLNVFAREFSLVINANHKNLLKPMHYDSCERKPFLVLPFCEKGSIMKDVGKMTEEDAWRLLRDVASGLAWLHNMNPPVIHQDIKPDNIMTGEKGDFMITDFGVSTHVKSTLRKSMSAAFSSAGTIAYMAPERFSKDNTPIMANDIYSLGATVYEMLTGDTPFGDDGGLLQMKGAEVPELKGDYSKQLKEVIARCLRTNPWERPTAEQLEKYAEDGLNGRKITFAGDKTFWEKYRLMLIIAIVVIAGAGIATGIAVSSHKEAKEAERQQLQVSAYNDSVASMVKTLTARGDSLAAIGALHDEAYEVELLRAFHTYGYAMDCRMHDGSRPKGSYAIEKKREQLKSQLLDAYKTLNEKADIFSDDEEIAAEFKGRAKAISDVIDISAPSKEPTEKPDRKTNE